MSKKLIYLCSFVLVLGLVLPSTSEAGDPNIMGWWKFDGDALDSSGNERHGTLHGSPTFGPGVFGQAMEFQPNPDYVTIDGYKGVLGTHAFSITAWIKTSNPANIEQIVHWGTHSDGQRVEFRVNSNRLRISGGGGNVQGNTDLIDGQWHHVAATVIENASASSGDVTFYVDGREDTIASTASIRWNIVANPTLDLTIGWRPTQADRPFIGSIDDLLIYDKVLTQEEVARIINGEILPVSALASNPSPANEQTDVLREATLSWTPGEYAPAINGHKLFLSENFSDVNDGIDGVTQDANSYAPSPRLDFGKTYYWRVDEANNTTGWDRGELWQFTTEPVGYAIANITATASSVQQVNMGPENTVNGSGLDANDLHSTGEMNMWLSSTTGPQPSWIQYEFDKVYKLHEMWVWNSNQFIEPMVGFGFKDVSIEYSSNGTDYTTLGTTAEFAQGPGTPDYVHNTTIDFGGLTAKYVRLTANSNWGGILPQYGLSEVRFLYVPIRAREPNPDSGATDVDVDVTLSFRAGREADQHDVYFNSDEQAVIDGNVPAATVPETSYGPLSLDLAQTYYWKINEVNMAETPTTLEGDVWNLTTSEFLVVDDFESYNDLDPEDPESNRIFNVWIDGYEQPANGSIIGYAAAPFAEQSIVHSGGQSMPLFYDNTGTARYSEAELTLSPAQDWTKSGVTALSLWFSGEPNNVPDQMYVKINGSKVTYDGDAGNLTLRPWQPWNIDLASLGAGLQNVTKLRIGFGDETSMTPGGLGVVFFDDIRLYPYSRQLATPAEPNSANLVAHYEFEGTTNDSSGSGLHGTAMGSPTFVAGKVGQAISLSGLNDFVEITGYKGILGPNTFSITAWVKTTYMGDDPQEIVYYGTHSDGQRCEFRVHTDGQIRMGNGGGQVLGLTAVTDGGWHHVAATIIENATNSSSDVRVYVDGQDDTQESTGPDAYDILPDWDVAIGYRPSQNDRFFMGQIDDVRIYDRALTHEEVAWLAGRTESFDKPF